MEFKSKVEVAWYEVADHLDREDVMYLLKVANIYMEYFEKRALCPELPVSFTINTWLRYVDDVLTIVKKGT